MSALMPSKSRWQILADLLVPIAFFTIIGAALLGRVWLHQRIMSLEYEVSDLMAKRHELALKRTKLEGEIAELSNLSNLEATASLVHHMQAPRSDQIINSEPNDVKLGANKDGKTADFNMELAP